MWWEIHRLISGKKRKPHYLLLENVDRLIKSPVNQRGRDFALMLASLSDLGYSVEWRVINAADYGMPQRRRRVFIFAFHTNSPLCKKFKDVNDWMNKEGVLAKSFPIEKSDAQTNLFANFSITGDLVDITNNFNANRGTKGIFENTGMIVGRDVYTFKSLPKYKGPRTMLGDILISDSDVPDEYFLEVLI